MAEPETPKSYLDIGGSFLKDLPRSIKRYPYEGECSFLRIFNLELDHRESSGHERNDFFLFHMNRETIETLFNSDNEPTTLTRNCSSFDLDEQLVLIKMPSFEHSSASGAVDDAITATISPMGLFGRLHKYSHATIQATTRGKQPDHGWGPKRPPPGYPRRPSVVLEVAWSESESILNSDIRFWLNPTDGNARICLTLRVDRHEPAIRIEKWTPQNGRVHCSQIIRVTKVLGQICVTNHPLIIPFEDLFLRPPSIPAERDIEISQQALQGIADTIWDFQEF
ncbi:hypothetical protein N7517_000249 [Penicillium concentricum]|uniref:Uncharacterized protein n=1 Tax=Penicillium concentricum TaxID=293559 RepID=A0A9W9SPL9_9EURO|nr:uncharacterized protein N7517_000249 [Penicillium concentricum]KAJ5382338.1 hypothetical protein N7517_000249 [Penicillium concentricum]